MAPIGMVRVNHAHTGLAVIHDFCVLPAYQGKGYGRDRMIRLPFPAKDQNSIVQSG
ncbi:GNAT family N-acetyltransferase [Paenibacillus brasilensis]|uniref:GNAT superfamily N-acetyltransferase n=1 Tax=Paenibacillus brasilensis TaxID=128574 RepID=A0ABU0L774_9BACL|nr:GNAT superfamily N-acetyltransferase [Paenibacillus brasilensis]